MFMIWFRKMPLAYGVPARHSIRLPGHDYSQIGQYFITICAYEMRNVFGKIENGAVVLNVVGRIAFDCWREIPEHFAHVELDRKSTRLNSSHMSISYAVFCLK